MSVRLALIERAASESLQIGKNAVPHEAVRQAADRGCSECQGKIEDTILEILNTLDVI